MSKDFFLFYLNEDETPCVRQLSKNFMSDETTDFPMHKELTIVNPITRSTELRFLRFDSETATVDEGIFYAFDMVSNKDGVSGNAWQFIETYEDDGDFEQLYTFILNIWISQQPQ